LVGSRDHRTNIWKGATQGPFHQSLVAIGPVVSEEKIKMFFCFYLMMEIVVESSSVTEIPSVLPFLAHLAFRPCELLSSLFVRRETVQHYILHCDQYEEAREKLIHDMFLLSGSMHLSLEVLLTLGADEEVSLMDT
jgi:hypothetical protein